MFSTAEKTSKPATLQRKAKGGSFFGKAHSTEPTVSIPAFFAPAIQPKLSVSTPGDTYETEADATADRVMRMPEPVAVQAATRTDEPSETPRIDRQEVKEEEEKVQPKAESLTISRMPGEEPDEKAVQPKRSHIVQRLDDSDGCDYDAGPDTFVQAFQNRTSLGLHRSDVVQRSGRGSPPVSQKFEQSLQTNAGGGNPLPDSTRSFMENRFGADFSGVRVHTDASAQEMSRDIHAHAFTHGNHIYFNSGKFDPDSSGGKTLLAHELTHTIQQGAAPVTPTVSPKHQFTAVQSKAIQRQGAVPQLDQAVAIAKGEEGKVNAGTTGPDGNRQGWERLTDYFKTSMGADKVVSGFGSNGYAEGTVSEEHIKKKSLYNGQVANQPPDVRAERDAMPSWCGIFVFWALNKGGVPMPKWTLGGRAVTPEAAYPPGHTPKAGDIAYRNTNSHYAIVEKADGGGSSANVTSVNGNTAGEDNLGGQIQTRSHPMSQWDGFFNPLTLMQGNLRDAETGDKNTKARSLKELRKEKYKVQRKESDGEELDADTELVQTKPELSSWHVTPDGHVQRAEDEQKEEEPEDVQRVVESPTPEFSNNADEDDENTTLQRQATQQALIVQARSELAGRISNTPAGLQLVQASWLGDAWDAVSGLAGEIADLVEEGLDAAKNWLLGKVRDFVMEIPGYKLLRVILGYDPITGETVARNPMTLLEAVLDIIPVGGSIVRSVLDYFHATEPVANWLFTAVQRFIGLIESIGSRFEQFWDSLSIDDVGDPDGVIERIASLFRGIVSDIVNFVSDCATTFLTMVKDIAITNVVEFVRNYFPTAFDLLCVILGENPITHQTVARNGTNILNAGLNVLGERGQQIKQQMMANGIFQRCAAWIDRGIRVVTESVQGIKDGFITLWNTLSFESLFHPVDTFNTIVDTFRQPVTLITDFLGDAVRELLKILKEVLLDRLSAFAKETRGYFLVTVILGRDPFTGKDVERNAENLIHGFMSLMDGGEAQFQQMKESGAIDRTTQKIMAAIKRLNFTWAYIVGLFTSLWESMDWTDFLNPIAAFGKIIGTFAQPVRRLIAFIIEIIKIVVEVLMIVMNFPIDVVTSIINKIIALFDTIKRDPIGFLKNLLRAIKQGFIQFFDNILTHLLNGLADWFFYQLRELGIQRPTDLSFKSILKLVMEVLGISLQRIMDKVWKKLEEKIGKEKVAKIKLWINRLEGIWKFIKDVMERGPIAIWEYIQEQLSNLWTMVIEAAKNWIMEKIVNAVIAKLLSMLDPTGIMAVINSVIAIYRAIQSAIEYLRQMLEIINSFVDGVAEIAVGNIKVAADFLERTAARGVPVMIGFLANQVGLGKVADKLVEIIGTLREKVDKAIDWLVDKAVSMGLQLLESLINLGKKALSAIKRWLGLEKTFTGDDGETHKFYFAGSESNPVLMVRSNPTAFSTFIGMVEVGTDAKKVKAKQDAQAIAVKVDAKRQEALDGKTEEEKEQSKQKKMEEVDKLLGDLAVPTAVLFGDAGAAGEPQIANTVQGAGHGITMTAVRLNKKQKAKGSPPTSTMTASYTVLNQRRQEGGASYYVKGHLLNDNIGGKGVWENLTPLSREGNSSHEGQVESLVKAAFSSGGVVEYNVTAVYGYGQNAANIPADDPLRTEKLQIIQEEVNVPTMLHCEAYLMESQNGTFARKQSIVSKDVPNPIGQDANSYVLAGTPARPTIYLNEASASVLATIEGVDGALAGKIKLAYEKNAELFGKSRFTSYFELSDARKNNALHRIFQTEAEQEKITALADVKYVKLFRGGAGATPGLVT
ncbi:DUF4157 domain-containing protein [Spirosoma sp. KNUC1025]|uniref:eCIS core domain-containing protein n=1 Tax=Spirosoma sp. KNUC1025 TaxID=2894082 RepID=UPI003867F967|nr:DUF4157 domain-containing protein [Spirosoma sp. KNUC1025]